MLMPREWNISEDSSNHENTRSKRILSLRILYFTNFLVNVSFSILLVSVWPFLDELVVGHPSTITLGIVNAGFCVGQFIASPFFGILENKSGGSKIPIVVGLTFQFIGNVMWSYLQDLPRWDGYMMLATRIIMGMGAGNMASIRSYVSRATTLGERTQVNAIMSLCMGFGVCVGPGLQAGLAHIGYPGPVEVPGLHLNAYTSPTWIGAIFTVANIVVIIIFFKEFKISDEPVTEDQITALIIYNFSSDTRSNESLDIDELMSPDYCVVFIILFSYFNLFFIFTMMETMTTPLSQFEFGWGKEEATQYIGWLWLSCGVLSIFAVLIMQIPCIARIPDRYTLLASYGILLLSVVLSMPLAGPHPEIFWINMTNKSTTPGRHLLAHGALHGGCPSTHDWCFNEPRIYIPQMYGGTFLLTIGFSVVNLYLAALYSKVLGPRPQGLWMGYYTASGSLSRVLGSVYMGISLEKLGPRITLMIVAAFTTLVWFAQIGVYKRLISYAERLQNTPGAMKNRVSYWSPG